MPKVIILECIDKTSDPGSEGRFLLHMFNMMEVSCQYTEIRTRAQFLAMLKSVPGSCEIVHISTHGSLDREKFTGFWTHGRVVYPSDLVEIDLNNIGLVTTACMAGSRKIAKDIIKFTGCDYFVGPEDSPSFRTASLFSHIFYHNIFVLRKNPAQALRLYNNAWTNKYKFRVFE